MENLFAAWYEFRLGKRNKKDVQDFEYNLEDNLFHLHFELKGKVYQHLNYTPFYITDPKLRHIHKATVRDRVLHHAVFRKLYPIFDRSFIYSLYSCRIGKGSHRALDRLELFARKVSKNQRTNFWALKCDVSKFFDSINKEVLLGIIAKKIVDPDLLRLISQILCSYDASSNAGIPLGNVTSQLFANIYLNELDQFMKRHLKVKYYLRYCDDFIILSQNRNYLERLVPEIRNFLESMLRLALHPRKVIFVKSSQGIDFLGYVVLPYHRVLRTRTKRRILRNIRSQVVNGSAKSRRFTRSLQSYLGVLKHCRGCNIRKEIFKIIENEVSNT